MASEPRSSLSSAFDDMLEKNWRELDDMYAAPSSGGKRDTYRRSEAHAPTFPSSDFSMPAADSGASSQPSIVNQLNERFGGTWRYDVTERHRDGEEVVVLCKLSLPDQRVTKAQFGIARIGEAGAGSNVQGSTGGVSFSLGTSGSAALTGDTENAAYDRAIEDALGKCAAML